MFLSSRSSHNFVPNFGTREETLGPTSASEVETKLYYIKEDSSILADTETAAFVQAVSVSVCEVRLSETQRSVTDGR